jgi:dipeptidyl aminopeptidase/acylaminoacyl peptidase
MRNACVAVALVLLGAGSTSFEHRQRHEASDIATLAALTRVDHSTLFFHGYAKSGYVRDGAFHALVLEDRKEGRDVLCRGRAVSRDGSKVAYVRPTVDRARCEILLRDLKSDLDTQLAEIAQSAGPLAWSWDDSELAYQGRNGVFAVSTRDGRERLLARLPLRVNGRSVSWSLMSLDWFHQRSELLANAEICVPTRKPGECQETGHVLILAPEDSRLLALGLGAAISPVRDQVAFITATDIQVIDADQSNRRRITTVPLTLLSIPPFLREESGWSRVSWSPHGDRLWFDTVLDEEFNSNYYLVDVKDGRRRRILSNTSLDVTDWRSMSD